MIEITSVIEVEPFLEGLKAVVFDLDDTLYGEKEYIRSGYRAVAGYMPTVEKMEEKLWEAFEQKKSAIDEVLLSEGVFSEERKQECLSVYRQHQPEIHLYEGVPELLRRLRSEGYKLGIITDGRPEGQRAKIRALKLERVTDCIIVTDELGGAAYRKPNKVAFEKMREMLGVEFEEMCYIGDNIKKDFVAPEKLGMRCIWVRNKDGLYFSGGKDGNTEI